MLSLGPGTRFFLPTAGDDKQEMLSDMRSGVKLPWLTRGWNNPSWNKLLAGKLRVGTTINEKTACSDWRDLLAGTTSGLEQAVGWNKILAGNSPWLETALAGNSPGWKQPWLETARGWKPIAGLSWILSSRSFHASDMPQNRFYSCRIFAKLSGKLPKFNTTFGLESPTFLLPFSFLSSSS